MINISECIKQCILNKNPYLTGLCFVLFFYIAIYLSFLLQTNFLPYVLDNNETFSNLIHAKNLYDFGLTESFGLTDESYGLFSEAHPYVYTHQGNFPRIYAFLLYSLGIRSAEWQIGISTFTIGLAGIWFCYHYFAKYVSSLFSVIFCLLLMTDYIMFAQWQVNTWRVWHLFFFFSSFLCCHGLNSSRRKLFIFLSIVNFACLFYMEICFALFVFLSCIVYLFLQKEISWKTWFLDCTALGMGSALGMGILVIQNIAYLGWDDFLQDFSNTFISRNHFSQGDTNFVKDTMDFYKAHKITFWDNFYPSEGLRNPIKILKSFYYYNLLPYTPFITLAACIVMIKTVIVYIRSQASENYFKRNIFSERTFKYLMIFSFSFCLFFLTIFSYPVNWGKKQVILEFFKPFSFSSFVAANYFFFKFIDQCTIKMKEKKLIINSLDAIATLAFFFLISCISYFTFKLNREASGIALFLQERTFWGLSGAIIPTLAILLFISNPLYVYRNKSESLFEMETFKKIIPFLLAISLGFLSAYLILPGYIISAYFSRYCCYTVFFHISLYAWFFYIISVQILSYFKDYNLKVPLSYEESLHSSNSSGKLFWKLGNSLFLLVTFSFLWFSLQSYYIKEFPPEDFNFVKLLQNEPFHNHSIVSNQYAAPFSFVGQNWAYFDPEFGYSTIDNNKSNEIQYKKDLKYLWLADELTNQQYQKPEFFICWSVYSFDQLGKEKPKCSQYPFINLARRKEGQKLGLKELAADTSGRDKWSIIDLRETQK